MFFGVLTIFMSSFIKKCDAHATEIRARITTSCFLATKRDTTKRQCLYGLGTYCDPFGIPDQHWVDDVSKWLQLTTPVFIPTLLKHPEVTQEKWKAFKSLEAYNYYQRLIVTQMISTST